MALLSSLFWLMIGKGTEILQADISPFAGILQLVIHPGLHFVPALHIILEIGFHVIPDQAETLHVADTTVVFLLHLLPECETAAHLIIPRHMMEPEQILLGASLQVIIYLIQRFTVLAYSI